MRDSRPIRGMRNPGPCGWVNSGTAPQMIMNIAPEKFNASCMNFGRNTSWRILNSSDSARSPPPPERRRPKFPRSLKCSCLSGQRLRAVKKPLAIDSYLFCEPGFMELCQRPLAVIHPYRHGRARPGHPRLLMWNGFEDVDARNKCGHDESSRPLGRAVPAHRSMKARWS